VRTDDGLARATQLQDHELVVARQTSDVSCRTLELHARAPRIACIFDARKRSTSPFSASV